jgi:hypothetical protein
VLPTKKLGLGGPDSPRSFLDLAYRVWSAAQSASATKLDDRASHIRAIVIGNEGRVPRAADVGGPFCAMGANIEVTAVELG